MPPYLSLVLPSISAIISGLKVSHGFLPHFADEQTEASMDETHLKTFSGVQMGQKWEAAAWTLAALSLS